MRKLIWLVVIATLAYAGYWFFGARKIEEGAQAMIVQARSEGWGDAQSVSLAGFPSRFDLTFDKPELRDRNGAWSWKAPFAQLFALGYAPNELIAYLPSGQTITLGDRSYTLDLADMRASTTVGYSTALPLEEAIAVLSNPVLKPDTGTAPTLAADQIRLAISREDKAQGALKGAAEASGLVMPAAAYRLGAEAVNLTLPPDLAKELAPKAGLPATVARLHLDAIAGLRAPITQAAAQEGLPGLMTFSVSDLSLSWGGNDLSAKGDLTIDPSGYPEGTIMIRSASWKNWIDIARGLGMIGKDEVKVLRTVGTMMAANDPGNALEVPMVFHNGLMSLGPIPLGAAPQFLAQRQ
ncbi:MAG: DUF2125 domain-containing protein [Thioclava marina]|uniref:DUF2125 domain-containing protein n=1 Tax=Thioclava marina TaxID=1915077 RepID=A0ABX3MMS1_9RHOB|nr:MULTISPECIES: DUF2125 domain-containing protein [Thioclava]MBC7146851.1 DUF2125 domain-containing protein [Thioclava marina]MBD3804827.1 DUF2125 domain-containing protein [Thioclava sp.]OOY12692.1 hypothetical protein BMG00_02300 [Thioclava marina]